MNSGDPELFFYYVADALEEIEDELFESMFDSEEDYEDLDEFEVEY